MDRCALASEGLALGDTAMRFNVSQLLKSAIGAAREYRFDEDASELAESVPFVGRVAGRARLIRTNRGILAHVEASAGVRLTCSRCLDEFVASVRLDFHEEFWPTVDLVTGVPLAEPEAEPGFVIGEDNVLDATEAIRQYAILELPIKPLCRADCPGLCEVCGENLNTGRCTCTLATTDSRWGALAQFLEPDQAIKL